MECEWNFFFTPWTLREKFTATVKISRSEKVYNRRENISCREKFQSPWNLISRRENLPPCEKVTVSVSAHTEETFYFSTHFLMIYNANFRDLVLVCLSHSRSNYQRWKLHVIHCYLIPFFFRTRKYRVFFRIVKQFSVKMKCNIVFKSVLFSCHASLYLPRWM